MPPLELRSNCQQRPREGRIGIGFANFQDMASQIKNKQKERKSLELDTAATYNAFKDFEGKRYTGMKIGRGHKWHYDKGVWEEKKIAPDEWQVQYSVTKRRSGKAPEGSGVPVGTQYHWYIIA